MDPQNTSVEELLCDESFQRYCRGEEQADIQYWETWISQNPHKQADVASARRLYEVLNMGQGNRQEQLAALRDAVARRTRFKEDVLNNPGKERSARIVTFRSKTFLKYAAGIMLFISAGTLAYIKYGTGTATTSQLAIYEYYTGANDRKTIMLPDSSVVMLNENSHLTVNKDFDASHRQVSITGEAFFDIQHDVAHPFLVNTAQYTIRVLGTTFNVRSYPGKDSTETTLLTGKIEITRPADGKTQPVVVLQPNQKFILENNITGIQGQPDIAVALNTGKVVRPVVIDTTTHHLAETSWARRKMEITDMTLAGIAQQLQTWYGIKIRFADESVKNYRYTATFDDETVFNALRYLQQSYPFTFTLEDDGIVIAKAE